MRPRHGSRSLALACLLAAQPACGDDDGPDPPEDRPVLLADLPGLQIGVSYMFDVFEQLRQFTIGVAYDRRGLTYCPQLDASTFAQLAGIPVPIVEAGRFIPQLDDEYRCVTPWLSLELAPDVRPPDAQLSFGDASLSLTYPFGDILLERTLQPTGAAGWTFAPGQTVALAWSPAADLAALLAAELSFFTADHRLAFELDEVLPRSPDTISFVPPDVAFQGTLYVQLRGSPTPCGPRCTFLISQVAAHEVAIAR